jgi:hypothetical protein
MKVLTHSLLYVLLSAGPVLSAVTPHEERGIPIPHEDPVPVEPVEPISDPEPVSEPEPVEPSTPEDPDSPYSGEAPAPAPNQVVPGIDEPAPQQPEPTLGSYDDDDEPPFSSMVFTPEEYLNTDHSLQILKANGTRTSPKSTTISQPKKHIGQRVCLTLPAMDHPSRTDQNRPASA